MRRAGIRGQLRACLEPHVRHGREGLAADPSCPKQPHAGSTQSAYAVTGQEMAQTGHVLRP
jgi:hypothetical protein